MKRIISLGIGLAVLGLIYAQLDRTAFKNALLNSDPVWLLLSLAMVIPLTLLTAWRFRLLSPQMLEFAEANRLILAASTLNLVLPSKMGDIAKAYFLTTENRFRGHQAFALVVFEKAFDMLALLCWCLAGLLAIPGILPWPFAAAIFLMAASLLALLIFEPAVRGVSRLSSALLPIGLSSKLNRFMDALVEAQLSLRGNVKRALIIGSVSLILWLLHLLQIAGFTMAIGGEVPLKAQAALAPLSIFAGLLPLTFAGIGTRDAAVILLYAPYLSPAVGAVLGLLMTARYLLPGLIGIPLLGRYLHRLRVFRSDAGLAPR